MLRRLHPQPTETVEDVESIEVTDPDRRAGERPWVMVNMVASIDGATALGGGSTDLNDEDDRRLFHALRAAADVVLVGASTVRAEDYGPVSLPDAVVAARRTAGLGEAPRLAIVSRSLGLDPRARVFGGPTPPYVFAAESSPVERREALDDVAEVVTAGRDGAEVGRIVERLGEDGHRVVLCEGGPSLNGQLAETGLIDEMDVTINPTVVGGDSKRMVHGPAVDPPLDFRVDRVLAGERMLFLRFRRG